MAPLDLIQRDLEVLGPIASAAVLGAPIVALCLVVAGRPLARVALALGVLAHVGWFAYYALDIANPGLAGAVLWLGVIAAAWLLLAIEIVRGIRRSNRRAGVPPVPS